MMTQHVQSSPARVLVAHEKGRRLRRAFSDDLVIRMLATDNPKREITASYARFAFYRDGMSVADYLRVCVRAQGGTLERYRGDVRWDADHGYISLEVPVGS